MFDYPIAKGWAILDVYALNLDDWLTIPRDNSPIFFFDDTACTTDEARKQLSAILGISPPMQNGYTSAVAKAGQFVCMAALLGWQAIDGAIAHWTNLSGLPHSLKRSRMAHWVVRTKKRCPTLTVRWHGGHALDNERRDLLFGSEKRQSAWVLDAINISIHCPLDEPGNRNMC